MPTNISSQQELDAMIASSEMKPVIIDFWAAWCGPCRMLAPILDEIESEGHAVIAKVDVDSNPELARTYQVQSIPMLRIYRGGVESPRSPAIGVRPKGAIVELLQRSSFSQSDASRGSTE